MTNKEKCSLKLAKDVVPDAGLGEFMEGYTSKRDGHPYKFLWWLLVPIVGWIVVPFWVIIYVLSRTFRNESFIYLYEEGFLWVVKSITGKSKEYLVRYDEVGGMQYSKTRKYQTSYAIITVYQGTHVNFNICDKEGVSIFGQFFSYRNEHEVDDKYNACGFAVNAILERWDELAINRVNRELNQQGYARFYTNDNGQRVYVDIGRGFIKTGSDYAGNDFRYSIQDGYLFIYPSDEDRNYSNKKEYFTINVNQMYDSRVFFLAASQLLGIK